MWPGKHKVEIHAAAGIRRGGLPVFAQDIHATQRGLKDSPGAVNVLVAAAHSKMAEIEAGQFFPPAVDDTLRGKGVPCVECVANWIDYLRRPGHAGMALWHGIDMHLTRLSCFAP